MVRLPCEGDACDALTLTWDPEGRQFVVTNHSDRRARMTFHTWRTTTALIIEPRSRIALEITEFDHPYQAVFVP